MKTIINLLILSFLLPLKRDTVSFTSANPFSFRDIITNLDNQEKHEVFGYLTLPSNANENNKEVFYRATTAEELIDSESEKYDVVTCLEVIEHVPDPQSLVTACSKLLKPGGSLFLSTINRNPRSWITAIVGAEYIFNILPKGTHEFAKFIKPSELAGYMRNAEINLSETKGMFYNPITHKASLNNDLGVNYLMYGKKPSN